MTSALRPTVAMVNQAYGFGGAAGMDGLFQGVEHEPRLRRGADAPAHDFAGIGIDDESHIDEPFPGGDIGEIRHPQPVGRGCTELPVHLVNGHGNFLSEIVVLCGLPRMMPWIPMPFISRATVQRATSNPSRPSCRQIFRTP
jgi:hypothetical protein